MARSKSAVYTKKLELDRIVGIRHDKGQRMTYVPVKKEKVLKTTARSIKSKPNITSDGEKY